MKRMLLLGLAMLAFAAMQAKADTFVGSWEVDQGPPWPTVPLAYTGQEAAALLFGGVPSDYVISTLGTNPALINGMNWVSTWGGACGGSFPCGTLSADNFVVSDGGLYETWGDTSSYVDDWAVGAEYTNYAFRVTPEPSTFVLFGSASLLLAFFIYRRSKNSNSAFVMGNLA